MCCNKMTCETCTNAIFFFREMAIGNTFGATALTWYGGFWISLAISFTPGGFGIQKSLIEADNGSMGMFYDSWSLPHGMFSYFPNVLGIFSDIFNRDGSSSPS